MKAKKQTALAIDTKGNRWKWNCGWYIVDENGEPLKTRQRKKKECWAFKELPNGSYRLILTLERPDIRQQPMSHAEFRRNITILDPTDKKQREVLHGMDRPGRAWRRYVHREVMDHELFGSVYLLASDGCHAVIETQDGAHEYVCFENLSEKVGVPLPPRGKVEQERKTTEKRKEVVASLISKYMASKAETTPVQ